MRPRGPILWAMVQRASAALWVASACRPARPPVHEGPIAVLPFSVEPESDAWMGEPLAEETERALERSSVAIASLDALPSADYVLTTTLDRRRVLNVRVRLTRASNSSAVFERTLSLTSDSLGTLPAHIAALVAANFGRPGDPDRPAPTPAYLTYLRALSYRRSADPADVRWAAELFRQVIAADSGFAPAWRGLGEALRAIAITEGGLPPGLEAEWRDATQRSATLDSIAAVGRKPVAAGAESQAP